MDEELKQSDGGAEVDVNSIYASKAANTIIMIVAAAVLIAVGVREVVIKDIERQTAVFSQLARDCLKDVLKDSGVVGGVRESLDAAEMVVWQSCIEQGRIDQWLYTLAFDSKDEIFASAVRAVEEGK